MFKGRRDSTDSKDDFSSCSQGVCPIVRVWEIGFVKYGDINQSHSVLSRTRVGAHRGSVPM